MTPAQERVREAVIARTRVHGGEARALRQALGVSLVEVAAAIGAASSSVSRWERGAHVTSYAAITYMRFLDELAAGS